MTKWKYMYVTCNLEPQSGQWVTRYINGKELPNWTTSSTMPQASDELGEKGWELVGFDSTESAIRLVFKRPNE